MILDWEDFEIAARDLCAESPGKTRLLSKYRHSDGILTLKVTDGPTVSDFNLLSNLSPETVPQVSDRQGE